MEISIVGYSSIVERKILNAFNKIKEIKIVNIFSRRKLENEIFGLFKFKTNIFHIDELECYSQKCKSIFYYISTENSTHDYYSHLLLKKYKNVIVDKPISISKSYLEKNITLAKKNNCFFSEALVWEYHSQVDFLKKYILANKVDMILIRFTIPIPAKNNFRVNKSAGSGVFWDMSSYFFSAIELFNLEEENLFSFSKKVGGYNNQWFNVSSKNKVSLNALFGFGFPYQNKLEVKSQKGFLNFNRIFTSDNQNPVFVDEVCIDKRIKHEFIDDSFLNYFKKVTYLINKKEYTQEIDKIIYRYEKIFNLKNNYE